MSSTFRVWLRLSRFREWAQSKVPFIAAAGLLLAPRDFPVLLFMTSLGTVALWASFGYGVNEWADREVDQRAGKSSRASGLSSAGLGLFLILTSTLACALSLVWAAEATTAFLVLGSLAFAASYSLPPVRLKERGLAGLFAAACAQWFLPVLAVSNLEPAGWLQPRTWHAALLGLAIGMRWMAVHQLLDLAADRRAGVRTYATEGGDLWRVIRAAFAFELVLLATILASTWPRSVPACIALGLWTVFQAMRQGRGPSLRERLESYRYAPLAEYYFLLLPLALSLDRSRSAPEYLMLAMVFLLLGFGHATRMVVGPRPGSSS